MLIHSSIRTPKGGRLASKHESWVISEESKPFRGAVLDPTVPSDLHVETGTVRLHLPCK